MVVICFICSETAAEKREREKEETRQRLAKKQEEEKAENAGRLRIIGLPLSPLKWYREQ